MSSLYELDKELEKVLDSALDTETGEIGEGFITKIEELSVSIEAKREAVALRALQEGYHAGQIDTEIKRLQKLKTSAENREKWFKRYLSDSMQSSGQLKLETARVKIGFRKSASINITNERIIPDKYMIEKITYSPDKDKIAEAIKDGEIIPGAELVEKQNIQIK